MRCFLARGAFGAAGEGRSSFGRKILSGELIRSYYLAGHKLGSQITVTLATPPGTTIEPLILTLSPDLYANWRNVEAEYLEGIHRGQLKAKGKASQLEWTIGRDPIMVVKGREKIVSPST